jgi:hypothetical protein
LSANSNSREHIHSVMLNATFYVGIAKLMARLECSKSAGILYAINEGLFKEGLISEEDYILLKRRYGRKLKEVLAQGREDSHKPVLTLEQMKDQQRRHHPKNKILKGMLDQWDIHTELDWRIKAIKFAENNRDLEYAELLIAKGKNCDIISQKLEPKETS